MRSPRITHLPWGRMVVEGLGEGMDRRLRTMPETLALLTEKGVDVHVAPTPEAVELYNTPAESVPVGGLFHSTC